MAVRHPIVNNRKRKLGERHSGLRRAVPSRGVTIAVYLFLVAISVAVFGQTVRYEFVNFDDDLYVYNAPAIQAGLTVKGLALAFTSPHARNWHPLTTISHMLDCQLNRWKAGCHTTKNILLTISNILSSLWVLPPLQKR